MRSNRAVFAFLLLFVLSATPAGSFTGEVVGVLDGDTIEVLHNGKAQRIRLQGIDCPEKGQPYGNNAKQATSSLVFAQVVTLEIHGKDKYGRVLADVSLADGTNVNQELVKEGWCWWYRKYAQEDTMLENLETEARDARKGLWVDPNPVPPWEWRKRGNRKLSKNIERYWLPSPAHICSRGLNCLGFLSYWFPVASESLSFVDLDGSHLLGYLIT